MAIKALRRDNHGAALITVLVAMLFLSIIASIVLSIVHSNLENSRTGMQSTNNFYGGEVILDKFVSSINDKAEAAMVEVYEKWLQIYSTIDSSKLEAEYFKLFDEAFREKIKNYINVGYFIDDNGNGVMEATELRYTGTPSGDIKDLLYGDNTPGFNTTSLVYDEEHHTITGISITTVDENGNTVTIETDLVMSVNLPTMEANISKGNTNVEDYILIADGQVHFKSGKQTIVGNIYGGGKSGVAAGLPYSVPGILMESNGKVRLYANRIITRTSLNTKNGTLEIAGKSYPKFGIDHATVWAQNILMDGSQASSIQLFGQCNVADDLSIDSNSSSFTLGGTYTADEDSSRTFIDNDSEYYGYVYNTSTDPNYDKDAEGSSSITINGKGVKLDLSAAQKLLLAGKDYVSVPKNWNFKNVSYSEDSSLKPETFMLGESLSCRWLQSAYLLPGECIKGIKHNPMLVSEYNHLKNGESGYGVDLTLASNRRIALEDYLKPSDYYFAHYVQYGNSADDRLVYLYMRFDSPAKAAKFFQGYSRDEDLTKLVASRITMAGALQIKLPAATKSTNENGDQILNKDAQNGKVVINTGNLLAYPGADGSEYTLYASNTEITSNEITNVNTEKTMTYKSLYSTLDPSRMGNLNGDLVRSLINIDQILAHNPDVQNIGEKFKVDQSTEERDAYMVSCQGNLTIGSGGAYTFTVGGTTTTVDGTKATKAGIVVVDGNVKVQCDYWGIIIATGDITFDTDCTLRSTAVDLGAIIRNNTIVKPFFTENVNDHSKGSVDLQYKDWKKE